MAWQVYGAFPSPDYYPRHHKGYAGLGPLPCKRWVKRPGEPPYKLAYRWRPYEAPNNIESRAAYNGNQALKYVEWLAARDGIKIPTCASLPITDGVMISNKYEPRVRGVSWGHEEPVYATRKDGRRGAFLYKEWIETFRIEIPHWDFVHPPIEQCDQSGE